MTPNDSTGSRTDRATLWTAIREIEKDVAAIKARLSILLWFVGGLVMLMPVGIITLLSNTLKVG